MRRRGFRGGKGLFAVIAAISFSLLLTGAILSIASAPASAADAAAGPADASNNGLGFIGMALATGLACIGAGIAVGSVGSAALGLVGEQPGAIGTTLIYVGLAEGVAIYGIVISIIILSKLA
jgi:V/A-type H+-transporting ATPase subunit K